MCQSLAAVHESRDRAGGKVSHHNVSLFAAFTHVPVSSQTDRSSYHAVFSGDFAACPWLRVMPNPLLSQPSIRNIPPFTRCKMPFRFFDCSVRKWARPSARAKGAGCDACSSHFCGFHMVRDFHKCSIGASTPSPAASTSQLQLPQYPLVADKASRKGPGCRSP